MNGIDVDMVYENYFEGLLLYFPGRKNYNNENTSEALGNSKYLWWQKGFPL
jgi:hypothetical protein